MRKTWSSLLLAATLAGGLSYTGIASAEDRPKSPPGGGPGGPPPAGPQDGGGPPPGGPGGGQRGPGGGGYHVLPPRAAEQLKLTPDQMKQLADLEQDVKAKLDKILTPEQKEQLKQMRPPRPQGGGPGDGGPGGGGPGGGGPGGGGPGDSNSSRPKPPAQQ